MMRETFRQPYTSNSPFADMTKPQAETQVYLARRISLLCLDVATPSVSAVMRCVNNGNIVPSAPFLTWATAATNIQVAIDAANAGDRVLMTNGVHAAGGAARQFLKEQSESNSCAVRVIHSFGW